MNVSLTPILEDFIRHKVASGLYNNSSEVIREALRLLVAREPSLLTALVPKHLSKEQIHSTLASLEMPLRKLGLSSLALFGSVLDGSATNDSDIDLLIELDSDKHVSLVDLVGIKLFLEEQLGNTVDVVTRQGIDPVIRDDVFAQAEAVF